MAERITQSELLEAIGLLRSLPEGEAVLAQARANLSSMISEATEAIRRITLPATKADYADVRDSLVALRELLAGRPAALSADAIAILVEASPGVEESIRAAADQSKTLAGRLTTWYGALRRRLGLGAVSMMGIAVIIAAVAALTLSVAALVNAFSNLRLADQGIQPARSPIISTGSGLPAWLILGGVAVWLLWRGKNR